MQTSNQVYHLYSWASNSSRGRENNLALSHLLTVTPYEFDQKLRVHTVQGLKLRMQLIREYRPSSETKGQLSGVRDSHWRTFTTRTGELPFFFIIVHSWGAQADYGTRVSKCDSFWLQFRFVFSSRTITTKSFFLRYSAITDITNPVWYQIFRGEIMKVECANPKRYI